MAPPIIRSEASSIARPRVVWDLKKKKIKRKHQLDRPGIEEVKKAKAELESDTMEETEGEKHALAVAPEVLQKLFPVVSHI